MAKKSPAGKGCRYRVGVDQDKFDMGFFRVYGPAANDLDYIFEDPTKNRLAYVFSGIGCSKFVRKAEERHLLPLIQEMKLEISAVSQGCKCRDWMREGIQKGKLAGGEVGCLQGELRAML